MGVAVLITGALLAVSLPPFFDIVLCVRCTFWLVANQTLATGVLAVLAALSTTCFLYAQIRYQTDQDQNDRDAKLAAVRGFGPPVLNDLSEYGWQCFGHILRLYDEAPGDRAFSEGEEPTVSPLDTDKQIPHLKKKTLKALKEWIEVEESENQKKLIIVLENYQLIHSRFPKDVDNTIYKSLLDAALSSTSVFTLVVEECWEFARQAGHINQSLPPLDVRIDALFRSANESVHSPPLHTRIHDDLKTHITGEYNRYTRTNTKP